MRIRLSAARPTCSEPTAAAHTPADQSAKRRPGATTMEYLVMLSFILLGLIITVQAIGTVTGGLFKNSADATAKTNAP